MTKVGRLLCQVRIHKWEEQESIQTPLVPILGIDDTNLVGVGLNSDDLAIETRTRICKYCGKGEVINILHW